ncbi:MAG TPA: Crp/Fnr family transcriptional regulator [Acidimicrobiales bacterium]|nr:Crp/Fnr family transcriptional regulator [Acidimicrobiales bacterium]
MSELAALGRPRHYRKGAVLFAEGDRADRVIVVVAGQVKVTRATDAGREVVLAVRGPGEVLGELSAVDGGACSATAVALEPVDARIIPASAFRAYLAEQPGAAYRLLEVVVGRLREADRVRVEFGGLDTVARVASRLSELAREYGAPVAGGTEIALALSQDELAGWVGSSREAVAKALRQLRDLGCIETGRRRIVVRDLARLERLVA